MIVGFTGTREGMSAAQLKSVRDLIKGFAPEEFHHGDCVGADNEAANVVAELVGGEIIRVHPPADKAFRAFSSWGKVVSPPKGYHARNRDIVDASDILVAAPITSEITKETRGGTGFTVNYAISKGKQVFVVWRDGIIEIR